MGSHMTCNDYYNTEFVKFLKRRICVWLYKNVDIYYVLASGRVHIVSKYIKMTNVSRKD